MGRGLRGPCDGSIDQRADKDLGSSSRRRGRAAQGQVGPVGQTSSPCRPPRRTSPLKDGATVNAAITFIVQCPLLDVPIMHGLWGGYNWFGKGIGRLLIKVTFLGITACITSHVFVETIAVTCLSRRNS